MKQRITFVLIIMSLVLSSWPLLTSRAANGQTRAGQQGSTSFIIPAIVAGSYHSLALKSDGTVIAWGNNDFGQSAIPTSLSDVTAIAAGSHHSLALKSDGTVIGWGNNDSGQSAIPTSLSDVTAIAAGQFHSLALKSDGTVIGWGNNDFGQTTVPADLRDVTAIAAGGFYSLALKNDGTVVAWGNNDFGQTTIPADLRDVTAIAAGSHHSLALKSDGTVSGWGNNDSGQSAIPTSLSDVTAIAAGQVHSLALKSDGTVVTWGATVVPADLSDVTAIAAGQSHSLALKSDGTVVAWGGNAYGQAMAPTDLNVTASAADSKRKIGVASAAAVSAPTITPTMGISIPAGSTTPRNLQIANTTSALTVTATLATGSGVTLQNIRVDTTGKVTADLTTGCGATTSKFTLRVTNSANVSATALLTVTVTANTPPTLTYQESYVGYRGTDLIISPVTGPNDNGSISSTFLQSVTATPTVAFIDYSNIRANSAGIISIARFAPAATYTITMHTVDNCGASTIAKLTLKIVGYNTPPRISSNNWTMSAGGSKLTLIAFTFDTEDPASLLVTATLVSGSGVTLNNINIKAPSSVWADVTAACNATTSTFKLTVTDSGGLSTSATLTITVTPNTPPTLTYLTSYSKTFGTALIINPTAGPSNNGTVQSVTIRSISPALASGITVNSAGVISVASTVPRGTYTVTVRALDNCGAAKDATFTLAVK